MQKLIPPVKPQLHYASITCYKKQQLINAAVQLASNGFTIPNLTTQPNQPVLQANVDAILKGLAMMFNITL